MGNKTLTIVILLLIFSFTVFIFNKLLDKIIKIDIDPSNPFQIILLLIIVGILLYLIIKNNKNKPF